MFARRLLRESVQGEVQRWYVCALDGAVFGLKVRHLSPQLSQLSFHLCCLDFELGYSGFLTLARLVSSLAISDDSLILSLLLLLSSLGSLSRRKNNLEVWNRLTPSFPLLLARLLWLWCGIVRGGGRSDSIGVIQVWVHRV